MPKEIRADSTAERAEISQQARVFLSYARGDSAVFAERMRDQLNAAGFDAYLDKHDIQPGEPWRDRLHGLIARAEKIIFLISPRSVRSETCAWEIDHAERLGKSLLPIVCQDTASDAVPGRLSRLNYIFMRNEEEVERAYPSLVRALSEDLAWDREKARIADLAEAWNRDVSWRRMMLVRKYDVDKAEAWRDGHPENSPPPTETQLAFIAESRRLIAVRQRRNTSIAIIIAIVGFALAGYATWQGEIARNQKVLAETSEESAREERDRAIVERARSISQLARAQIRQGDPITGLLLGLENYDANSIPASPEEYRELARPLYDALSQNLPRKNFRAATSSIRTLLTTKDGKRSVTVTDGGALSLWNVVTGRRIGKVWRVSRHGHPGGFMMPGRQYIIDPKPLISGNDRFVIFSQPDNSIAVLDVETGKLLTSLQAHKEPILSLSISDNSNYFTSAGLDNKIIVWETNGWTQVNTLDGYLDFGEDNFIIVGSSRFSPSSKHIVLASNNASALWDFSNGKVVAVDSSGGTDIYVNAQEEVGVIYGLSHLLKNTKDTEASSLKKLPPTKQATAQVVDFKRNQFGRQFNIECAGTIVEATKDIVVFYCTNNKSGSLTELKDGAFYIYDVHSGMLKQKVSTEEAFTEFFRTSGDNILALSKTGKLNEISVDSELNQSRQNFLSKLGFKFDNAAFAEKKKEIALLDNNYFLSLYRMDGVSHPAIPLEITHGDGIIGACLAADGKHVVPFDLAGNIYLQKIEVKSGTGGVTEAEEERSFDGGDPFSPGGSKIRCNPKDGNSWAIYDREGISGYVATSERRVFTTSLKDSIVVDMQYRADGQELVIARNDGIVTFLDAINGKVRTELKVSASPIRSVAFLKDGEIVAAADVKGAIYFIPKRRSDFVVLKKTDSDYVRKFIEVSDDNNVIAVYVTGISSWSTLSSEMLWSLEYKAVAISAAELIDDGSKLAVGFADGRIRIHDARTGRLLSELSGHKKAVTALRSARNPGVLLSGSDDETARAWSLSTGQEVARLEAGGGVSKLILLSGDGIVVVADGRLWRWNVFADTFALAAHGRNLAPRCLTLAERREFSLTLAPPSWCITGSSSKSGTEPAKWEAKWPYNSAAWRSWLLAKHRGETPEIPSIDE